MPTRHFVVIREKSYKATGVNKTIALLVFLFDDFYLFTYFEIDLRYVCICVCDHNSDLTVNDLLMQIIKVEERASLPQKIKKKIIERNKICCYRMGIFVQNSRKDFSSYICSTKKG